MKDSSRMDIVKIDATDRSPEIEFDFLNNIYSLSGESYPENTASLYVPLIEKLAGHLELQQETRIEFTFELIYFNSSSARVILKLFDLLDKAAENNEVIINWCFEEDDDAMEELGEEFGEDLVNAVFNLKPKS